MIFAKDTLFVSSDGEAIRRDGRSRRMTSLSDGNKAKLSKSLIILTFLKPDKMESEILDGNFANTSSSGSLSNEAKAYLGETAKWAKFIAIVNFVFIGFTVLGSLSIGTVLSSMPEFADNPNFAMFSGGMVAFIYLVFAVIWFIPTLYSYQFATKTQRALRLNDEPMMTEALGKLKSHYKFWGIFMAIIVGFYALMFVFGIFGAMMM